MDDSSPYVVLVKVYLVPNAIMGDPEDDLPDKDHLCLKLVCRNDCLTKTYIRMEC